jgi:hypothetical protein
MKDACWGGRSSLIDGFFWESRDVDLPRLHVNSGKLPKALTFQFRSMPLGVDLLSGLDDFCWAAEIFQVIGHEDSFKDGTNTVPSSATPLFRFEICL